MWRCCARRFRGPGDVVWQRWRRVLRRVLKELRLFLEAKYAGQLLAFWRDTKRLL